MTEIFVCELCRNELDPRDRATIQAVERERVTSFESSEWLDGPRVMFHSHHFPGLPRYRRLSENET